MDAIEDLSMSVGLAPACEALGVPRSSFYRHRRPVPPASPPSPRPAPQRALTDPQRQEVLAVLHSPEFVDQAPAAVYAELLDRSTYLCSVRTMYRVLDESDEVRERRQQRQHPVHKKPELLATGPNQVWSWDITKLRGPRKWESFSLYTVLDIYSRYVPGWMVARTESAALARQLLHETCEKQGILPGALTIHQDRGAPMTSKTVAQLYADLGVEPSFSRPHVSDDNPFSEAQFKTLKYRPNFPGSFGSQEAAVDFCRPFFRWYNCEHHHSGIAYLTPEVVHHGLAAQVIAARQAALDTMFAAHPERFVAGPPRAGTLPAAVYINPPKAAPSAPTLVVASPWAQPVTEDDAAHVVAS